MSKPDPLWDYYRSKTYGIPMGNSWGTMCGMQQYYNTKKKW